jgi:hypothetical protein
MYDHSTPETRSAGSPHHFTEGLVIRVGTDAANKAKWQNPRTARAAHWQDSGPRVHLHPVLNQAL